jgi:hypothetical protein
VNPTALIASATIGLAGCAATPTRGVNQARSAELAKSQTFQAFAEPCSLDLPPSAELPPDAPEPPPTTGFPEPGPFTASVFLDTAFFVLPTATAKRALHASRDGLTHDPEVRLLGTPHLSAAFDTTARATLEDHVGPLAAATLRDVTVTPRQATDAPLVVELDIVLLLPTSQSASSPTQARIHFVTAPRVGQAVTLTEQIPEQPGQSLFLLLKPYVVRSEADLRAIFLCKMAQRQRALASQR